MRFASFLTPFLLATLTISSPVPFPLDSSTATSAAVPRGDAVLLEERDSCYATCGSVCYYSSTINNAVSDGYSRYKSGNTVNSYPHTYNNYEGFSFGVSGPYQEWPVMSTFKAYTGGSPGPDRVIFNTGGKLAGVITHTGASGNNFVECN